LGTPDGKDKVVGGGIKDLYIGTTGEARERMEYAELRWWPKDLGGG